MKKIVFCVLAVSLIGTGCASTLHESDQGYSVLGGAATGALAGAVVGGVLIPGFGAAPGAAIGAVAGGVVGAVVTEPAHEY